jgi:mannosyl-oligosaccharide alpha-1,2-mannosidase
VVNAEYLLKQWLQTNQTEIAYHDMYSEAMRGIRRYLAAVSPIDNSVYTLELIPGRDMQGQL